MSVWIRAGRSASLLTAAARCVRSVPPEVETTEAAQSQSLISRSERKTSCGPYSRVGRPPPSPW